MNARQLATSELWHSGPEWLCYYEEEICVAEPVPEACLTEMTVKKQYHLNTSAFVFSADNAGISNLIDISRFSDLGSLLRVTAYVFQFVKNLKARLKQDHEALQSDIDAKDTREAKQYWISDMQKSLQLNKNVESWKRGFDLFTDCNGIIIRGAG